MAAVYLDTSFVSACVTDRSDPKSIYRRDTSLEWMRAFAPHHDLYISAEVIGELSEPGHRQADAALKMIEPVPILPMTPLVRGFAHALVRERVMPGPVRGDAIHVAIATLYGLDVLLSWNVRHLANPNKLRHLQVISTRLGFVPPTIVTPELFWE